MKLFSHFVVAMGLLAGTAMMPSTSHAVTCPADDPCNDNSYTATFANMGGSTYQATITVNVLGAQYDGVNYMLSALGIKNMTGNNSVANASLFSSPGGGDPFDFYQGGVNNGGDICADESSPGDSLCAWAGFDKGVLIDQGDVLTFVFQFDASSVVNTVHIKYQYLAQQCNNKGCEWKKYGSLGSFDIPFTGDDDDDEDVPEPGTLALLGLGLMGLGLSRRRRV